MDREDDGDDCGGGGAKGKDKGSGKKTEKPAWVGSSLAYNYTNLIAERQRSILPRVGGR
jgi:hypothetical protein